MAEVKDIENAVKKLHPNELKQFRQWFAAFDTEIWDAQIKADATSGKLDALASAALEDYESGKTKEL